MSEEKNTEKTEKKTKAKDTKKGVSFEALSSLDAPVSFWKGIPFGLQHVMAMFVANLAPIFLVATAAKMDAAQSAAIIQAGLLVAGLGTCLQLYGVWLIGSRLPMVTGISFTYVAAAMSIAQHQGYGAVAGAVVLGGRLEVVLGLTAKYWRRFVPPIVSAIVVTSIGFSLLSVGATSFGGGSGAKDFGSWQNLTLGLISLVACLAFQLLMRGTAKQLSVLFGLVVGYVVAIFMGKVDFSGFANLQVVSVPHFMPFKLEFDPGAIISFALLYVVSSVEVLGDTAALTKVGLDRQPTDKARQLRSGRCRGLQLPAAGCAWRLHHHDVRQYHPVRIPDDFRGRLHAAQHHHRRVEPDHWHRFHPGRRHFRQLPGAVPVHLRFQLHRGVVRGGCDSQRRSA